MRATELDHKIIDHTVKMQPVVIAGFGEVDKILSRYRHLVLEDLGLEGAKTGFKCCDGIRHS